MLCRTFILILILTLIPYGKSKHENSVKILHNIPRETILNDAYLKQMIENRKPVIIRQSINSNWDAISKWNDYQYLIDKIPSLSNAVLHNGSNFLFYNKFGSPFAEYTITPYHTQLIPNMSSQTFFEYGLNISSTLKSNIYPSYSNEILSESLLSDLNDYNELTSIFKAVTNNNDHNTYLWLSFENFTTQFHYDVDPNLYYQIYGNKKWRIISPKYWNSMYVYPSLHPSHRQSQVINILNDNTIEFELNAGDMLFLPSYWFHQVQTISNWSASINFWVNGHELNTYLKYIASNAIPYQSQYQLSHSDVIYSLFIFIPYLSKSISIKNGKGSGQQLICDIVYNSYKTMIDNKRIQFMRDAANGEHDIILYIPRSIYSNYGDQVCEEKEYHLNVDKCPYDFGPSTRFKHKIKKTLDKFSQIFLSFDEDIRKILFANYVESVIHSVFGLKWTLIVLNKCFCEGNPYWD